MQLDQRLTALDEWLLERGPARTPLNRYAIGLTILLAGVHKLVSPEAWHRYLAEPLAMLWPVDLLALDPLFMLFGVSEIVFGLVLLSGWHRPTVAVLTGLSLLGVVANLVIGIAFGAPHVDILIRDLGLMSLAFAVAFSGEPS